MKQPMSITVQGKRKEWSFTFQGDPKHLPDWAADGLDVAYLESSIPEWVVDLGLMRVYNMVYRLYRMLGGRK